MTAPSQETLDHDAPPAAETEYDWAEIESRWQALWQDSQLFQTPALAEGEKGCFVFAAYPFTSGSAHIGHVRSYTLADAYARFRRAHGDPVLFSMGFDSFGLPTELEAIKRGLAPHAWVEQCSAVLREQLAAMGYSFDWERTLTTSEEDMYRWSQWLFLTLLDHGFIYRRQSAVDWCDSCETVLARSETEEGCCWRCGSPVRLVRRMQWFLRSSSYIAENEERLERLPGWNRAALGGQRAVLGRVSGVELTAAALDGRELTVFTPYEDSVPDAAFVALSLNFPELGQWLTDASARSQVDEIREGGWQRSDRGADVVPIVDTAQQVSVPGVEHMLPVIVSPSVDARFGATALLGIPTRDTTDETLSLRLPVTSSAFWRIASPPARPRSTVRYSAQDYPVSRQRAWGSPVPVVHCPDCGVVPVGIEELPVRLPQDLEITGSGNALADHPDFADCRCPACGGEAKRETDTLDCSFDHLWIWMAPSVPRSCRAQQMFTHPDVQKWLPIDQVVWGMDGGADMVSHRTVTKMLRDCGVFEHLSSGEPFQGVTMHEMVTQDGRKMSKHLGNVVNPDELVERVGADTLRFTMLHAAAPRNAIDWSEQGLDYSHRFLQRLWRYAHPRLAARAYAEPVDDAAAPDKLRSRLARWCDVASEKIANDFATLQMHRATRNIVLLLTRIEDFERRTLEQRGTLERADHEALRGALLRLTQLIAPIAPHIAEELWAQAGNESLVSGAPWPQTAGQPRSHSRRSPSPS
jgi:leucyl-tRNA synthetase